MSQHDHKKTEPSGRNRRFHWFASFMISLICSEDSESRLGDFEEEFAENGGKLKAYLVLMIELILSIPIISGSFINRRTSMYLNYLKSAIRNLRKSIIFTAINIMSLSIGIAICLIVLAWVQDESNFDTFHPDSERLYSINIKQDTPDGTMYSSNVPAVLAEDLFESFPEIIGTARTNLHISNKLTVDNNKFYGELIQTTDPEFFKLFDFPLLYGEKSTAFSDINSIIISQRIAEKLFGVANPLDRIIAIDGYDFTITGVFEKNNRKSNFILDYVIPVEANRYFNNYLNELSWDKTNFETYILLSENSSESELRAKLKDYISDQDEEDFKKELHIKPVRNAHLYYISGGYSDNFANIIMISVLGLLLLVVACINYMNLATARASTRSKEIGIRKVNGATKKELFRQFLTESVVISFAAFLTALLLLRLFIPIFNTVAGKDLGFQLIDYSFITGAVLITLLTGIIAGFYPAIYLASMQPVNILKGKGTTGREGSKLRKALVISQFTFSIILIIFVTVLTDQIALMKSTDLTEEDDRIISIKMDSTLRPRYETLKTELINIADIENVSASSGIPRIGLSGVTYDVDWPDKDKNIVKFFGIRHVNDDFVSVIGKKILFGEDFISGTGIFNNSVILNKAAADLAFDDNPVGKTIEIDKKTYSIQGVVEDYFYSTAAIEVSPLVLIYKPDRCNRINIRLKKIIANKKAAIDQIRLVWSKFNPDVPLDYTYLSSVIEKRYREPLQVNSFLKYLTMFAVIVSGLGLIGLASYTSSRRTKEIGIRRVLGSSSGNILFLLSKEYLKWVLTANIIAWTLDFALLKYAFQFFPTKIDISIEYFLNAGLLSLFVTFLAISYPALLALKANPVNSLRHE